MSKMLDVIMACLISGIAAFTTSKMGIEGLRAVSGAMLYQFMDANLSLVDLYAPLFAEFGFIISRGVLTALLYAILSVIQESVVI